MGTQLILSLYISIGFLLKIGEENENILYKQENIPANIVIF